MRPQKKSFKRSLRVQDRIREDVAELLLKKVRDPRIGFVTITAVEVSDDLRHAKIFVSLMGEEQQRQDSLTGLAACAPFIQREVWKGLEIKARPEIRFFEDGSVREGARMEKLFQKLKEEGDL